MRVLEYGGDDLKPVLERSAVDYAAILDDVKEIVEGVRSRGDRALFEYTLKFDGVELKKLQVSTKQVEEAYSRTDDAVVKALKHAHSNVKSFHEMQLQGMEDEWEYMVEEGVTVGERIMPLESVGCYVPGGRAAYPSTVLMTVAPAKIAGVERVVVVSPPEVKDSVLAACKIAGVDEIYSVGGAQAVAALAYGTESIKPVHKIVGPGNKYVTVAKMLVYGTVDVDMPAGPSEVLIVADDSADQEFIAADVLAQAEHDPSAQCVLVTDSAELTGSVTEEVKKEAGISKKIEIISKSLENFTIIKTKSVDESLAFANDYAPEHIEIMTKNAEKDSKKIRNAGALFIGPYSPVAAGDYASGGNHVLPTGGAARFSSQLSVREYLKSMSVQKITREGLEKLGTTISILAETEGLTEHRKSVEKRL